MATIDTLGSPTPAKFRAEIAGMAEEQLLAQDLVQQGAIHAVSFLLRHGCTEPNATAMLASLRDNAKLIREEAKRRGRPQLFERDQTGA